MVDLDSETIEVIKAVKDVLAKTTFDINRFDVGETGAGGTVINIDIRRHEQREASK